MFFYKITALLQPKIKIFCKIYLNNAANEKEIKGRVIKTVI
jgi:hypothetical protein